ncbi:MAG: carboxypeptidase regulatory-like domain-containing protein [Candidatus Acidiferrales bacterium]
MQIHGFSAKTLVIVFAILVSSVALETAKAQDIVGRISGTVTDTSGAVIPGASVTITDEASGVSRPPLTTNESGNYVADGLPVGIYTVTVEIKSFKKTSVAGNSVTAGGRLTVNVTLEVGASAETVTVTGASNTTNTTSGELSSTITNQQMLSIPLNQRHYESVVGLVPGAALQSSGLSAASITSGYNNSIADVNGERLDGQNWSVDGGWNLDSGSNNSVFNEVGIDFIQEVDVQTSNYDAEFGRSDSSTINVVTKSGGNQYHGGGFEFVQNNAWNAENPGTKLTNPSATGYAAVPPFHLNDFGWDLGGPIPYIQPKGKLFFFAGQEWKRFRGSAAGLQSASEQVTFPTAAEVSGNFTDQGIGLKVPALLPPNSGATAGCTAATFFSAANVINPVCLKTPDGLAIANLYTAAAKLSTLGALPTGVAANNLSFNLPNPADIREDIIRVDENANDKQSIYFRYLHDYVNITNPYSTFGNTSAGLPSEVPVDPDSRHRPGYNIQIGWTDIIGPNLISEFKFNADWHKQTTPLQGTSWEKSVYGFAFIPPLGNPPTFGAGLPEITFTGVSGFPTSGPVELTGPAPNFLESPTSDINPVENVTWIEHNHAIKFGVEFARNRKTQNSRNADNGNINFNAASPNSTGDPFADALLGNFNTLSQNSANPIGQFRFNDLEGYLEDTWKVTHRLSLVMGVRYLYLRPTYAQGNNMTEFNPFAFNPGLEPTFTAVGGGSILTPSSPGLCSGPLLNVIGSPTYTIECNGLERPGAVPYDQAGRVPVTYVDPTLLAAIPATAARGFYNPENLWAPRFGFSFAPFDDKTVIRGGFGIFYDHPEGNALCGGINCQGYVPWSQAVTINALAAGSQSALWQFDAAPAAGTPPALTTQGLNDIDPRLVVARSYQYSLSVQRELPQSMLLQVSYVGNQGRHILRGPTINDPTWTQQEFIPPSPNPNTNACPAGTSAAFGCVGGFAPAAEAKDQIRPYLGYTTIGMAASDVDSNYNALQMSLTKRRGILTSSVAYTYSKVMTMGDGAGDAYNENGEPECPYTCLVSTASNPVLVNGGTVPVVNGTGVQTGGVVEGWKQFYYGKASFDATHILAMSFTIESPWGKGMTGAEGVLVRGWSMSGIMHFQSGAPLTATDSVNIGNSGVSAARRANMVPGATLSFTGACSNSKAICWFNPNAFGPASELSAGDTPVNNLIGPHFYQWDLSLRKTFALPWREGLSIQLQGDAYNAFNQTNWNNPTVNNAGSASFGQITGSLPARVVQLGGKFTF